MTDWKHDGVRVIPGRARSTPTPPDPGHEPAAAINFPVARRTWAGTVTIHAMRKTGAHHHGHLESVIYVVKGPARHALG